MLHIINFREKEKEKCSFVLDWGKEAWTSLNCELYYFDAVCVPHIYFVAISMYARELSIKHCNLVIDCLCACDIDERKEWVISTTAKKMLQTTTTYI